MSATAALCTTAPVAIAMMGAIIDRRIRVGVDKSICAVNDEELGRYMSPSLTSIEMPDPLPYLSFSMEWMRRHGENWIGSLLICPRDTYIADGES